ncbi:MAG: DUF2318 domain-containing protein [Theionarchaea archaeon]|nr:DUF2318 domain-containing protein [Theionarchaea archaeon]MBU7038169.1 DUF2318 domain-containing protein [Theionarchaea archaeon]
MEPAREKKKDRSSTSRAFMYLLGIVICAGTALVLVYAQPFDSDVSPPTEESVRIPLSEVSEIAQWYEYNAGGVLVKYFAVRANDGSIRTGLDACDVCYRSSKGYSQTGSFMICNNCGNRYEISGLGTKNVNPGGCWPGYLPSYVEDGYLVIRTRDLEERREMFA